jgi:murein L,D-transpeptidase YafK
MKTTASLIILMITIESFTLKTDFLKHQKSFERVRTAFAEKEKIVGDLLHRKGLEPGNIHILIIAMKDNDTLELYARKKSEKGYHHITSYKICSRSGEPGPKRAYGDDQVPEGFYHIDRFNPNSDYYLSLGLNYPNQSDRKKSKATNLGGDIFIHGACITIGCLPITDDKIKELYLFAVFAKNNGQSEIPVYIFPFRMTDQNFSDYCKKYVNDKELTEFWSTLKTGYDKFETEKTALKIKVDAHGDYTW